MWGTPTSGLSINMRCEVCDLAFSMGLSENQFYRKFDFYERAQLLATYRSRARREAVASHHNRPKRGK